MNGLLRIFEQRIRGFRLIELVGVAIILAMFFWVFLSKVREGDDIRRLSDLDDQISAQQVAVNALKINVAQLEQPKRLENLAVTYLGMQRVAPSHETNINAISQISQTTSRPVAPSSPTTASASEPEAAPAVTLDGDRMLAVSSADKDGVKP